MTFDNSTLKFETGHQNVIHDAQMDFYGHTLATASSDRTIKIFQVTNNSYQHIQDLTGHTGPVWRVSWAHPRFGSKILASCGYDRKIIVWSFSNKEQRMIPTFIDDKFSQSVNCIQFSPGNELELIAGCADGSLHIYSYTDGRWSKHEPIIDAHNGGVNCLSFATPSAMVSLSMNAKKSKSIKRFVSGGCDHVLKIWTFDSTEDRYFCAEEPLITHEDWIRDVAWSPMPGIQSRNVIASCSDDKTVVIWTEDKYEWKPSSILKDFKHKVWSVSWSKLGNMLAVASGENCVQLFKQHTDDKWYDVTTP